MRYFDVVASTKGMNTYEVEAFLSPKLAHLHIAFEHIVSATNNFADDNLIKRGDICDVYKGELLRSEEWIDVVIRRFHPLLELIGKIDFLREITTLSFLDHRNTLSLIGYCDENGEMMMVFEYENNGSLDKYLSDPNFTWSQRLKICLGTARALRYIHEDIEHRLHDGFHHDIKSCKILLDEDWEPKLFCFGFHVGYDAVFFSPSSYTDPAERKWWTHMSDVYSFGVILFEVLCGTKAEIGGDSGAYESLVRMATRLYEEGKLDDIINPELRKQMHPQSLSIFSELAYDCLDKRSNIDLILERLQEALELPLKHENFEKEYAYLKIPLSDIVLATENFATAYCIRSPREGMVYKAELDHFDINSSLTIKGTVTIKRNISRNYGEVAERFIEEIELLAACKHPNVESLVGFSWEESEMIIVYESAINGSLSEYLGSTSSKRTYLTWEQRIRICLDIAHGLEYFGTYILSSMMIPHIDSASVMLGEKWNAKIANFEYDSVSSSRNTNDIAQGLGYYYSCIEAAKSGTIRQGRTCFWGTYNILDENQEEDFDKYFHISRHTNGMLKKYIYPFGVVLFEILFGRLAYDSAYIKENDRGIAPIARQHFNEKTLKNMVDPNIMEEARAHGYIKKVGPDRRSLDIFGRIAYQCLSDAEAERPNVEDIIISLNKALSLQVENLEHLEIKLRDIMLATNSFDETCLIGNGGYGAVYKAELYILDRKTSLEVDMKNEVEPPRKRTVAIKCILRREDELGYTGFLAELEIINRCEHPNVINLLGYCVEGSERILVYEYASNGSLDDYLSCDKMRNLTWAQRLKLCLGIAYGLVYLHTPDDNKECIIHRDIKSGNILFDENLEVKIADFGLSIFHPTNHPLSTINTKNYVGTNVYMDPQYWKEGRLKIESDIYSFGVVMFEILSGKLAYDQIYTYENDRGIAPVARRHFNEGKLKDLVDFKLMEETHELSSTLKIGPNQDSLDAFLEVAYKCLAENQVHRPTMEDVINGLKRALNFQENRNDTLEISHQNIRFDGESFSDAQSITKGGFGMLYNGVFHYDDEYKSVIVKRMSKCGLKPGIWREFEIPFKHRHENVIGLVGYCKTKNEKFIVYENASNRSLDRYMNDADFSWTKRLRICICIAEGLYYLHGSDVGEEVVIHRDIKSCNIVLTEDWKAKICGFEVSLISPKHQEICFEEDEVVGSPGYCDLSYWETHFLTKESDIYSFGVLLFEILCGRLACSDRGHHLESLVKRQFEVGRLDEIVFEGIKEQIVLDSLSAFRRIAFQCLNEERKERPTAGTVLVQLKKALEFQEAYEIWEAKLPRNYNEILKLSKSPEIYSTLAKKDLYNMLSNGILLQEGKLWFSVGGNGERSEMISSTMFSYKIRRLHRWRSIQESRFEKVAELLDISNLNIQIKKCTQLLVPGVGYSVYLVFKFCCPRKSQSNRMYVNLKYTMGNENLNAYFATWREDGWMMIELCRFSNHKKETIIEVLLKSFSRCYCDSRAVYIEGIEFQAIDDVKQEEIQQVLESKSKMDKCRFSLCGMKLKKNKMVWYSVSNTRRKNDRMVWYNSSNVTLSNIRPPQSRFKGKVNLVRQQVFRIKWKIECNMALPSAEKVCYLVFKLSEHCCGLYCPITVRDQSHRQDKETGILYFRTPSPWNLHDTYWVPKKRRDGWMEVIVWKYNSNYELTNGSLLVNLKLVCYEGTMSSLIVRGLEIRPS